MEMSVFNKKELRWAIHCFLIDHFPKTALGREWKLQYGKKFNWKDPQTLNEKIVWLMANTDTSLWTKCADKIAVRDYVKEKGLSDILTHLYGTWTDARDIDFETLPNKFVIKCNHDCGSTHIIDQSKGFDKEGLIKELNDRIRERFGYSSCEPHYTRIKPQILAEEFLCSPSDSFSSSLVDYKVWCFNGRPCYIWAAHNRTKEHVYTNVYDLSWHVHPEKSVFTNHFRDGEGVVPKPKSFNRMMEAAAVLSEGFHQVRVDFYDIDGVLYFGEMTFSSAAGRMEYFTDEFQREMGSMVKL